MVSRGEHRIQRGVKSVKFWMTQELMQAFRNGTNIRAGSLIVVNLHMFPGAIALKIHKIADED